MAAVYATLQKVVAEMSVNVRTRRSHSPPRALSYRLSSTALSRPARIPLTWQSSLNAIHGRAFFVQFNLDTLQSWLATAESVIGIAIEGVFVAMLIQRLFR
jgi:hypothetical protein